MKLLFLGDIVGRPGRDIVKRGTRVLARRYGVDLVIANGENAAAGAGLTRDNADEIFKSGVDVITGGNHIWDKREVLEFIDGAELVIHNAPFDVAFLDAELARWAKEAGVELCTVRGRCRVLDTLALAREMHPGQRNGHSRVISIESSGL